MESSANTHARTLWNLSRTTFNINQSAVDRLLNDNMGPSNTEPGCHLRSTSLPPWEKENIAQVPYMDSTSPSLSSTEREALPELWAAHTNITSQPRPKVDRDARSTNNSTYRSVAYPHERGNPWGVITPVTAPPPPRPYETPIYIPPGPKTAPNPPAFVRAPPTPPDSESSSSKSESMAGSPETKTGMAVLPGTMSSRKATDRVQHGRPTAFYEDVRRQPTRLQRWKSAFKDVFTNRSVDESQFERITERHWTDEY